MKKLVTVLLLFSIVRLNAQDITTAEYFFDADPGVGNGIPITISLPGSTVNFSVNIPVNTLTAGFHMLAIRVKNADGKWGLYERRSFYIPSVPTDMPIITAAEYFYDNDPGVGNGTALPLNTPGNIIIQNFAIPVPQTMTAGNHFLTIRVKDQAGNWSLFEKDTITVNPVSGSIACPGNVTADPFTNNCKAVVNNIDAVGLPEDDSSYTYTLTGATTGNGIGTASGQLFNAGVTTVKYALINSPTVSCSFTVTVNSSVTPTASIYTPVTTICEGTLATFVCSYTSGGFFTTSWQWKKNGINVGANSNIYRDSTLENNDIITVAMTSAISCAAPQTVTSAPVVMTVHETVTPSVIVVANATAICPGQQVTFTATPSNAGSNPIYEWIRNGLVVASGITYQTSTLAHGDSVYMRLYNTTDCNTNSPVNSNIVHITTSQTVAPSVNINASATTICSGTTVIFSATPINGGANPTYQWKLNGNNIPGATNSTYQTSSLQDADKVKVVMTSSALCASPSSAASEEVTMTVNTSAIPSVTIETNTTSICTGQSVTFTAFPNNADNNPVYEWTLNNNAVGSNSPTFQCSTLVDGDNIRVTMAPSQSCGNNTPVVSNTLTMTVGTGITPSVTISAVNSTACTGTLAIFYASPISGAGSSPSYQWKRNGINIPGATNSTYQSSSLQNGDVIRVAMTSSLSCASPQTVLSHDSVTMILSSVPLTPSVTISASANAICQGQTVLFTAVPTNGGELPGYQWKLNGINVGDNINTFSANSLQHGDKVTVEMFTSVPCSTSPTVTSDPMTMTVTTVTTFYADFDGDGYGNGASGVAEACTAPAGYVSNSSDCNDDNASIHPGATDICGNGVDDDCDGQTDENCTEDLPVLLVKTYPVKEGNVGFTIVNVEVKLDKPAMQPVSVNYATSNANAIAGSDYVAASGTLTIPVGSMSGTIQIKVIGDLLREDNESFWLGFSNPVNVVLGSDPRTRIMIIDDDKGKPNSASPNREAMAEASSFKIPTIAKRNTVWMIPQISNYENEVLILNVQGQVVNRFINHKNQTAIGNVVTGLYFYRIRITESSGEYKYYSGRLLITE